MSNMKGELPVDRNSVAYVAVNTTYKSGIGKMCKISQQHLTSVIIKVDCWKLKCCLALLILDSNLAKNLVPGTKFFTPAILGHW